MYSQLGRNRFEQAEQTRTEQTPCSVRQQSNNALVRFGFEQNKPNKLEPALFG